MRMVSLDCFDEFTTKFIQTKVGELMRLPCFVESDRPDLIQEFVLDLLQRRPKFDPKTGTWPGFVVVVCENCYATILEHRLAAKRSPMREAGSLNWIIGDSDGNVTEYGHTIADGHQFRRTGQYCRSRQESWDLAEDVASEIVSLTCRFRVLFEWLMCVL
jgi:hypothetical protein